ncbi:hypothetical protein COBT_002919 [Conglomerata obtusa]
MSWCLYALYFLFCKQQAAEINIIQKIEKINKFAENIPKLQPLQGKDTFAAEYNDKPIWDLLFEFNNDIMKYNARSGIFLIIDVPSFNICIQRIAVNDSKKNMIDFYKSNPNHKNIQQVLLVFSEKTDSSIIYWFVTRITQKFAGYSLKTNKSPIAKEICKDVCQGLVYLHETMNIVHNTIHHNTVIALQKAFLYAYEKFNAIIAQISGQLLDYNQQNNKNMFEVFTQISFSSKSEDGKDEELAKNQLFDLTFAEVKKK